MKVKSESEVAQSCLTLSDPMDHSLPGCSVHGIFQARVLEWVAVAFSNVMRQLPIKTFKRYHYMSTIVSKSQNLGTPNADQDVDQWKLSVIAGGNAE